MPPEASSVLAVSQKETRDIMTLLAGPIGTGALATLVRVEGSSYRRAGARLALTDAGRKCGSISGGCLETDLLLRLQTALRQRSAEVVAYDTTSENDLVWGVGLGCHGVATVLVEPLDGPPRWAQVAAQNLLSRKPTALSVVWDPRLPEWRGTHLSQDLPKDLATTLRFDQVLAAPLHLLLCGAGDDAQPLAQGAWALGWSVTVWDPRPDFPTPARFPGAVRCLSGSPDSLLKTLSVDPRTVAVVMTHHYLHDLPILRALLPLELPYLGLLGPRKRAEALLSELDSTGITITDRARKHLHAPVGLDLGAEGAEEVALSVIAEIQSRLARRDARPLRDRQRPIHADDAV